MNNRALIWMGVILLVILAFFQTLFWGEANSTILLYSYAAFAIKGSLAVYIYWKNPRSKINIYFAMAFFAQAIWDLGKSFMWITDDYDIAFMWGRISYTAYMASLFLIPHFAWVYLKRCNFFTRSNYRMLLWYTPFIFLTTTLWTSNMLISKLINPLESNYGFGIQLWEYGYGSVYNYFFLWFQVVPLIYVFGLFVHKYFTTKLKDSKNQLKYLVVGMAAPILIGIPTGVILPAMGIRLPPHNNMLTMLMSVFIAIGIIKYEFLKIKPAKEKRRSISKEHQEATKHYHLEPARSYLIRPSASVEISYKLLLKYLYTDYPGLIITTHEPEKIREKHGVENTPIIWLTDTETDHPSVGPNDIEQLFETIRKFALEAKHSYILLDSVDYLVKHNNMNKILHFVKQLKRVMAATDCCLIIPKGSLDLKNKGERLLLKDLHALPGISKFMVSGLPSFKPRDGAQYIALGHIILTEAVMSEFEERKGKLTVINNKPILTHHDKRYVKTVVGNPLSRKLLAGMNIDSSNTHFIITLPSDSDVILSINVIRSLTHKAKIVANIFNPEFTSIAKQAGANEVVPVSAMGGKMMPLALQAPNIVKWLMDATTYVSADVDLLEHKLGKGSRLIGKTIGQIDKILGEHANIIAVKTRLGLMHIPNNNYKFVLGDSLVLVANMADIPEATKRKVESIKNGLPTAANFWGHFAKIVDAGL